MSEPTTVIIGYAETGKEHLLCHIFQEMVKLAVPAVERYQCDLYHDAMWITQNVRFGPAGYTFYYGVRETGTSIGESFDLVRQSNAFVYSMAVVRQRLRHSDAYKYELVIKQAYPFPASQSATSA